MRGWTPSHTTAAAPPIWIGASGPRMLEIAGRYADGWWPTGAWTPEDYAEKLGAVRASAERAGRDPMAITPVLHPGVHDGGDDAELAEILEAPLVKAFLLQVSARMLAQVSVIEHPMGDDWRGYQDIDPATLTRERIVDFLDRVDTRSDPRGRAARHPETGRRRSSRGTSMRVCGCPRSWTTAAMAGLRTPPHPPRTCARPRTN